MSVGSDTTRKLVSGDDFGRDDTEYRSYTYEKRFNGKYRGVPVISWDLEKVLHVVSDKPVVKIR